MDLEQGSVLLGLNTIISLKKQYRIAKGRNWDWKRLSKTGQAVLVFLQEQGLDALRAQEHRIKVMKLAAAHWQELDLVFPSDNGAPFDASNVWQTLQRMCAKAGRTAPPHTRRSPHVGYQRPAPEPICASSWPNTVGLRKSCSSATSTSTRSCSARLPGRPRITCRAPRQTPRQAEPINPRD